MKSVATTSSHGRMKVTAVPGVAGSLAGKCDREACAYIACGRWSFDCFYGSCREDDPAAVDQGGRGN